MAAKAKSSKQLGPFARIMRIVLGFIGVGVPLAAFIAIFSVYSSNFDIRSKAAQEWTTQSTGRCNLTIHPPVVCPPGYNCVADTAKSGVIPPKPGQWGKCLPSICRYQEVNCRKPPCPKIYTCSPVTPTPTPIKRITPTPTGMVTPPVKITMPPTSTPTWKVTPSRMVTPTPTGLISPDIAF